LTFFQVGIRPFSQLNNPKSRALGKAYAKMPTMKTSTKPNNDPQPKIVLVLVLEL
jgi:hypothetical protein